MNIGIKEEKKLQEGSEVASQSGVTRTESKEVSLFIIILKLSIQVKTG